MKVLLDMNFSPEFVPLLAVAGHEVVHWSSIGDGRAPDSEIMAHAKANGFVVLTKDLDFGCLLAESRDRAPSVIQSRVPSLRPEVLVPIFLSVLEQLREPLEAGALVTIYPGNLRARILPL